MKRKKPEGVMTAEQQAVAVAYMPLARSIASRYARASNSRYATEFQSDSFLALIHAVLDYDPERNDSFGNYARFRIKMAMRDVFRLKNTRGILDSPTYSMRQVNRVDIPLQNDSEEICAGDSSVKKVLTKRAFYAQTEDKSDFVKVSDDIDQIESLFRGIPSRDQKILRMNLIEGYSQKYCARELGIAQSYVSKLRRTTIARIKENHSC